MASNANALKHQARLQEWTAAIQECRSSGQSVRQWCRDRGITTTTYYRWEREVLHTKGQLRNESQLCATPAFVELQAPQEQSRTVSEQVATVRINVVAVDIYPGMDAELLKVVLDVVRQC
ncbi:MAG: hypothetical protein LUC48_05975 [Clostridiales bacterium]|nr:hypothetical protein [Clostridiales bacterium]